MISLEKWKFLKPSQKLYKNVGYLGKNCCHRLWKVAQSAINRPIWSHCLWDQNKWKYIPVKLYLKYQLSFFKRLATEVSWNVFCWKDFLKQFRAKKRHLKFDTNLRYKNICWVKNFNFPFLPTFSLRTFSHVVLFKCIKLAMSFYSLVYDLLMSFYSVVFNYLWLSIMQSRTTNVVLFFDIRTSFVVLFFSLRTYYVVLHIL